MLEVTGTVEGAPPLVTVRSGCATSPATLEAKRGGTVVTADLTACGDAPGTVHLRALIDVECSKMEGSLRAPRSKGSKMRRFTARREQTLMGGVISGRVSARHEAEIFSLTGVSIFLHRRPGGEQTATVKADQIGNFALAEQPVGSYDVCAWAEGFVQACASEPVQLGASANEYREIELLPFGGALHGRVLLVDGSPCFQPATPFDGGLTATVSRVGGTPSHGDSAAKYLVTGFRGPGTYSLEVTCGDTHATTSVTVGHDELAGIKPVDLTVPNNSPSIALRRDR